MTTRATLHELVDSLPDDLLCLAEERLTAMEANHVKWQEVWKRLQDAPVEDEELSPRELAALERARTGNETAIFLTESQLATLMAAAAARE